MLSQIPSRVVLGARGSFPCLQFPHETSWLPQTPGGPLISLVAEISGSPTLNNNLSPQELHIRNLYFSWLIWLIYSGLCIVWFKIHFFFLPEEQFDPLYVPICTLTPEMPRAKAPLLIFHPQVPSCSLISVSSHRGILFSFKTHF